MASFSVTWLNFAYSRAPKLSLPRGKPGLSKVRACSAICCGIFALYRTPHWLGARHLACVTFITILSLLGVFFSFFPLL